MAVFGVHKVAFELIVDRNTTADKTRKRLRLYVRNACFMLKRMVIRLPIIGAMNHPRDVMAVWMPKRRPRLPAGV